MNAENCANIATHLKDMARQQADQAAIVEHKTGISRTYRQLDALIDWLACGALRQAGIGKGTRAVLMAPTGLEFFVLAFALFRCGAVLVAVDPGLGVKRLAGCLAQAQPQAFIGTAKAHLARLLFGWSKDSLKVNILLGRAYLPKFCYGTRLLKLPPLPTTVPQSAGDTTQHFGVTKPGDTAAILFTSGSTGPPKGALYTHGNLQAQVQALRELYQISPGEVELATFPLFALYSPVLGLTAVLPDMDFTRPGKAAPDKLIAAIKKHQVSGIFGSPALLDRLSRHMLCKRKTLPGLRRVISAGAPVAVDILRRCTAALPAETAVYTAYGATEALPISSISSRAILTSTHERTATGGGVCVGAPAAGVELRIIRPSDEALPNLDVTVDAPQGVIGEIIVKGAQISAAYCGRQEQTAAAKIVDPAGGFYHRTGDAGYLDAQGRLWYCGRLTQRVTLPDDTLYTASCEGIFDAHPGVRRSALVGVKDRRGRTLPVVCIEPERRRGKRRALTAELRALAKQFAPTRHIEHFLYRRTFPVDIRHNAKIGREQLAAWAAARLR